MAAGKGFHLKKNRENRRQQKSGEQDAGEEFHEGLVLEGLARSRTRTKKDPCQNRRRFGVALAYPFYLMSEIAPPDTVSSTPANTRFLWSITLFILVAGILFRICPSAGFTGAGFDEVLYRDNVIKLEKVGILNYPAICQVYLEDQRDPKSITKLPPTRFLYIYTSYLWKRTAFGDAPPANPRAPGFARRDPVLISLRHVGCLFSCLTLIASGLCAWRMLGLRALPPVLALMSCAPVQIHFAQHALIDGVFTFWATMCLWLLWENLRHPNDARRLAVYGLCLGLMVITKENSFFVFLGLAGLIGVNRLAKFGTVTSKLLLVSIVGPLAGVTLLVALAGGIGDFVEIYRMLVGKAETLQYAVLTGDGPWYRYLVDILLVSPLVLILAIGGVFTQVRTNRAYVFLVAFVGFTYLIMCNVRYGMNLRYASIWELPLRVMAAAQIGALSARFGSRQTLVATLAIVALCAYDLRQYYIYFMDFGLYELVTEGLVRAVKILK